MDEWIKYIEEAREGDYDYCVEQGLDYDYLVSIGVMGNVDADCLLPDFDW